MGEERDGTPPEPDEEGVLHGGHHGTFPWLRADGRESPLFIRNLHIEQIGSRQNNLVVDPAPHELQPDAREEFLSDVRKFRLSEARDLSIIGRFCTAMCLILAFCGGVLALVGLGAPVGLSTALGGTLLGGAGGAFAVHGHRAHQRLTAEAERVEHDLQLDRTREQALALISDVEDPVIRDRLRTMLAMRTLGLAPPPEDAVDRVFPPSSGAPPAIATE